MLVEIIFKGERKQIYANPQEFPFQIGDYAIVQAEKGLDLGIVNQRGAILKKKKPDGEILNIIRKPTPDDIQIYEENKKKEFEAYQLCRQKIVDHNLEMKLVDVEYQFDGNKITFYFTADKRVDFR
ncbi:MAG: hypothetical protein GXO75_02880, partial [Calditrichaeota bacterium]|nr:hypothetical protein [Calditrichota bacterium]